MLCIACVPLTGCGAEYVQSSLSPSSDLAAGIDRLFQVILWIAFGVFVIVEGALLVAVVRFRERPGRAPPVPTHGHTLLEISWTLAPAVVLILIAIPTIRTIWEVDRPPTGEAMAIEVVGHQWWWEFRYPELGITTANELHVPVGRTVDLHLSSADVIHSFWFPRVGGKRDLLPGHETRLWFTVDSAGTYTGQCAEFCGIAHALMGMRLVAEEPAEFASWVERMREPATEPADSLELAGRDLFLRSACIGCHTVAGTVARGRQGPDLTHFGSRERMAAGMRENTPRNLAVWLRDPPAVKPGALMPSLGLSEDQIGSLVAYLGSLR